MLELPLLFSKKKKKGRSVHVSPHPYQNAAVANAVRSAIDGDNFRSNCRWGACGAASAHPENTTAGSEE